MKRRRSYSIRERLFLSFFMTAAFLCLMVLYTFAGINAVAVSIGGAYKTNVELNDFQTALKEVESAMEQYISLGNFTGIESYFTWRGKLDSTSAALNAPLSPDPVLLLEYKVGRLMESFLEYADMAVYARRADKVREYGEKYHDALRVYGYLYSSVNELNALYFQRNISGYNLLFADIQLVGLLSIFMLAVVIGLNFLMVYLLVSKITGPLVDLSNAANEIATGNFEVKLAEIHTQDELGTIYRAFERMTVSIREYIDTIRNKALVEVRLRQQEMETLEMYKDAQLKTLQAQINPHFLFNTLNAGAQLAMMEGADATCTFIEKTADFFRYNIQNMDKETKLSEEITLVDNYMYIMKVRFADRVTYVKDIRCDRLDVPMPSMILQPLVENSIKHGISEMKSGGTVTLRVFREGGTLIIEISDNGSGMSPEMREQLLNAPQQESGIGMSNVITRLRMFYCDKRIFEIRDNSPEPGTTFSIRISDV